MSRMSEMDMIVEEVVDMVETDGIYLSAAMLIVAPRNNLTPPEFDFVYGEANDRIYCQ